MENERMKYEWEPSARMSVTSELSDLSDINLMVVGVAVARTDTGEACFIDMTEESGVALADYLKDISSDVQGKYDDAVRDMFATADKSCSGYE